MLRFVLLKHTLPEESPRATHWDFMLEREGVLRTWALEAEPTSGLEISAEQLPDHRLAYHDYEGPALRLDERERLVNSLGNREALILRNHGLLTVGDSIPECFNNHYRLERACQLQVMTLSCNAEIQLPPDEVVQSTFNSLSKAGAMRRRGILEWPSLLRRLDRIDPGYAH